MNGSTFDLRLAPIVLPAACMRTAHCIASCLPHRLLIAAPHPHHPTQLPSPSLLHIITMSQSKASRRSSTVQSFKVMDVLQRANQLESQGRTIYHCEVGQPESGAVSLHY